MISKVYGYGIKGQEFTQELGQRTILAGKNGVGKSVRSQTIVLTILGFIPGVSKTNQEMHAAFATSPKMAVAIEIDGTVFKRVFEKNEKGQVSQTAFINGVKTGLKDFPLELVRAGSPDIYQPDAFMAMSDRMKLSEITRLFPPAGNLDNVNATIQELKDQVNKLQRKKEGLSGSIKTLGMNRSKIETPPGSRTDVEKEIAFNSSEFEAQLKIRGEMLKARAEADAKLKRDEDKKKADETLRRSEDKAKADALIADRKAEEARRKAEADGIEKGKREIILQQQQAAAAAAKKKEDKKAAEIEKKIFGAPLAPVKPPMIFQPVLPQPMGVHGDLKEIREMMMTAGCDECAAMYLIDLKMKKFTEAA